MHGTKKKCNNRARKGYLSSGFGRFGVFAASPWLAIMGPSPAFCGLDDLCCLCGTTNLFLICENCNAGDMLPLHAGPKANMGEACQLVFSGTIAMIKVLKKQPVITISFLKQAFILVKVYQLWVSLQYAVNAPFEAARVHTITTLKSQCWFMGPTFGAVSVSGVVVSPTFGPVLVSGVVVGPTIMLLFWLSYGLFFV